MCECFQLVVMCLSPCCIHTVPDHCSDLETNEHVLLTSGKNTSDPSMTFACDPSYHMVGMSVLNCLANGSWSGNPPVCVSNCE